MRPPPARSHDQVQALPLYESTKESKLDHLHDRLQPIVHIRAADDEDSTAPHTLLTWRSNSSGSDEDERWDEEDYEDDGLQSGLDEAEIRRRCQLRRASEVSWGSVESSRVSAGCTPLSTSPLPSLSPSRPRLFDDDTDDEDEDEDDVVILRTPPSPLSRSPSLSRRSPHRKPAATDPLLSPAPSSPVLAHGFGARRQGWIPTPSKVEGRRLSTSSPLGDPLIAGPTTSQPSVSLLTQSLRSLARLPNLSIDSLPPQPPLASALNLEGLGEAVDEHPWEWRGSRGGAMMDVAAVDEAWEIPRKSGEVNGNGGSPLVRRLPPALVDNEHATIVQLQTFSSPAPPSPPRKTIDLPPLAPLPGPEAKPEVEADAPVRSPPSNRYISNPRHLLMISLELSMMRADKIRSPLRPRAVLVRCGGGAPLMRSALQFEVV